MPIDFSTYGYEDSIYAKKFVSFQGTKQKTDTIYSTAEFIRLAKNSLSIFIHKHLYDIFWQPNKNLCYGSIGEYNCSKFVNDSDISYYKELNSCFVTESHRDVYTCYERKYNQVTQSISFYTISKWEPEFYEKNTKNHKKGDLKDINITKQYSSLSNTLTYLARWGNPNTIEYLHKQINNEKTPKDKRNFFENVLEHIEKFRWDRLFELATRKRERIFKEKFSEPIFFESLTFKGRCRKEDIIVKNSKPSVIDAWICLSGIRNYNIKNDTKYELITYKNFYYPVKYSLKYHGNIDDYNVKHKNIRYSVTFDEVTKIPTFILTKEDKRSYVIISQEVDEKRLAAFDINYKRNILQSSEDKEENFNLPKEKKDDLINVYLSEVYHTYQLQKKNSHYRIGKKRRKKLKTLSKKVLSLERELIANVCKLYAGRGYNHIALEELNNTFGKCYIKKSLDKILNPDGSLLTEEEREDLKKEVNMALISKFLHISSIKDEFVHIAANYGIAVSFVQAAYTSQRCPICGHIHRSNRKTQERFVCTKCGYIDDADFNAAKNIKQRVSETVFREALLKQNPVDGTFRPLDSKKSKEKVRQVLDTVRYSVIDVGKL